MMITNVPAAAPESKEDMAVHQQGRKGSDFEQVLATVLHSGKSVHRLRLREAQQQETGQIEASSGLLPPSFTLAALLGEVLDSSDAEADGRDTAPKVSSEAGSEEQVEFIPGVEEQLEEESVADSELMFAPILPGNPDLSSDFSLEDGDVGNVQRLSSVPEGGSQELVSIPGEAVEPPEAELKTVPNPDPAVSRQESEVQSEVPLKTLSELHSVLGNEIGAEPSPKRNVRHLESAQVKHPERTDGSPMAVSVAATDEMGTAIESRDLQDTRLSQFTEMPETQVVVIEPESRETAVRLVAAEIPGRNVEGEDPLDELATEEVQEPLQARVDRGAAELKASVTGEKEETPETRRVNSLEKPLEKETVTESQRSEQPAAAPNGLLVQASELEGEEIQAPAKNVLDLREPEQMLPKLVKTMESLVTEERSEVRIELKPEHLGELKIRISMERGIMTAEFMVESRRVQELISAQLPQLYTALQEQGTALADVMINIDMGQQQEPQAQHQSVPNRHPQRTTESREPRKAGHYLGTSRWNRVDVRV